MEAADPARAFASAISVRETAPEIWVLLGGRLGDNLQMLALAEATGIRYRAIQLRFNRASSLPNWLLGASRLSSVSEEAIGPPWPAAVISSGRRAVPLATWIRRRSGPTTRLIHVGRPWAPLSWFDLVVTTPQYRLPPRANVVFNQMPLCPPGRFTGAQDPGGFRGRLAGLPRPHVAVFVGGTSRPYVLDESATCGLCERALELAGNEGTVIVVASPRTSAAAIDTFRAKLPPFAVVCPWNPKANPYFAVREDADRIIVTIDSVSMVSELITIGAPVEVFQLPMRRDLRMRFCDRLERAAACRAQLAKLRGALIAAGFLTSVRDLGSYVDALRGEGLFADAARARALQNAELRGTARRVRRLVHAGS
jgi:mitochondrial fission protein ELM1